MIGADDLGLGKGEEGGGEIFLGAIYQLKLNGLFRTRLFEGGM